MRSTMYNNSYFQKLLNNVAHKGGSIDPPNFVNIVDMKKKGKLPVPPSADGSPQT
jgi:hypothetical protein